MIAGRWVNDNAAAYEQLEPSLGLVSRASTDDRNFVKKAVNGARRSIGKRNRRLNRRAAAVAREIGRIDSPAARWIAADALRELRSAAVRRRLQAARRSNRVSS